MVFPRGYETLKGTVFFHRETRASPFTKWVLRVMYMASEKKIMLDIVTTSDHEVELGLGPITSPSVIIGSSGFALVVEQKLRELIEAAEKHLKVDMKQKIDEMEKELELLKMHTGISLNDFDVMMYKMIGKNDIITRQKHLEKKMDRYLMFAGEDVPSQEKAQKQFLGWTDAQISENRERRKQEKSN